MLNRNIHFGLMVVLFVFSAKYMSAQQSNRSANKTLLWTFHLPESQDRGPMDINVKGTYYFERQKIGESYVGYVHLTFTGMDISVGNTGFARYKYNDIIYTSTAMHTIDGLGSKGFDELVITSIAFRANVIGGGANGGAVGSQDVILDGKINPSFHMNKLTILDHLDLDLVAASTVRMNWQGSSIVEARIRNLDNKKKQQEVVTAKEHSEKVIEQPARANSEREEKAAVNSTTSPSTTTGSIGKNSIVKESSVSDNSPEISEKIKVNGEYVQVFQQNGKRYMKRADGTVHETTQQAYDQIAQASAKKIENNQKQHQQAETEKSREAQAKQNLQNQLNDITRKQEQYAREQEALSRKASSVSQAFVDGQRAGNSLNAAREASLSKTYASIEELESDFSQQMAIVNQETNNYAQVSTAASAAYIDAVGDYGTSYDASINEGLKLISGIAADAKAAKAKKEAQERLRAERAAKLAEIESKRKAAVFGLRQKMFAVFTEGKLPLESNHVKQDIVYIFAYIADKQNISTQENGSIAVSNLIAVSKLDDGSFPYKSTVSSQLKKFAPGSVTIVGFYLEQQLAEEMRSRFTALATKSGLQVNAFSYATVKKESVKAGDFWETGAPAAPSPKQKKPDAKQSSFWDE